MQTDEKKWSNKEHNNNISIRTFYILKGDL